MKQLQNEKQHNNIIEAKIKMILSNNTNYAKLTGINCFSQHWLQRLKNFAMKLGKYSFITARKMIHFLTGK